MYTNHSQNNLTNTHAKIRTELGYEEKEHEDGGSDSYDTSREGSAVEILIDLRVSVEIPNFTK